MKINRNVFLVFIGGGLLLGAFTGCTTAKVEPWQRAAFTDYSMRPDRDPIATMAAEHTYFSRESAFGGRGVGGSGCGCN
jgi:hypothetical protein